MVLYVNSNYMVHMYTFNAYLLLLRYVIFKYLNIQMELHTL